MKKGIISFEDFVKIDIRIGEVLSCQKIKGSNKLLKIIVDFGDKIGERQILSGISKYYSCDELVGKKIAVVINLEPRKIMGLESNGMILAAGEKNVAVLIPDKEVENGVEVR